MEEVIIPIMAVEPEIGLSERISSVEGRLNNMAIAFRGALEKIDLLTAKKTEKVAHDKSNEALIRKVAATYASDEEFATLMHLANEYKLDPLKKEIYCIKGNTGGRAIIMTSRDGYLKIANADPSFDGIESDAIYEGDLLTKRENTSFGIVYGENHLKYDKTKLTGAFCNVYRKDRSIPTTVFVSFKDYKKQNSTWDQYTNAMIIKVAESQALKRAFALSGMVSQEEMEDKE